MVRAMTRRIGGFLRPLLVGATMLGLVVTSQAAWSARVTNRVRNDVSGYTLQRGDTLSAVAGRFNVKVGELASANGITNIHRVRAGDRLTIPGRDKAKSAAPPAAAATPTAKFPAALQADPARMALLGRFQKWSAAYNVNDDLLEALAWMESGWQNDVVSSVSARGIGQLTPDTVRFVNERLLHTKLDAGVADDNIRMSARFMSYLLDQVGGDERMALAAYYQGLGSLRKYGPLPVSKLYIDDVMALRAQFA